MGMIREASSGRTRLLEPEHLVGRGPTCALRLTERYVSAQHAVFRWTGERWDIRDLGSRNGTFVNGKRIRSGEEHAIEKGCQISFGKLQEQWELVDASMPPIMAVPVDGGEPVVSDGELLALPSSEEPCATIYRTERSWVLEQPDESTTPITSQQRFTVGGRVWRFCCTEAVSKTSHVNIELEVRHLHLLFSVSRDEEHVQIHMTCGGASVDLGARTRNYLLLTLARRRIADAVEGLPETTCGWMYQEDLEHDPSMAPPQLNIDVFRLRKQLAALGVVDAANIVERRPRTRQLRIGTGRLSVVEL